MRRFLLTLLSTVGVAAFAADSDGVALRDAVAAGDPAIRVPEARYRSAFEGYPYGVEPKVGGWRDKNDLARRLGGWSAFAKGQVPDANDPAPQPGSTPRGPDAPAVPQDHGAHARH